MLAWRITRSRKSRFLSLITTVSIVGIALGVMALTIVISVTGGFEEAFRERILGLHPHLLVWPRQSDALVDYRDAIRALEADPRVLGATPATYDEMMIGHRDRRAGAIVKGVDPATVASVTDVSALLVEGSMDALVEQPSLTQDGGGTMSLHNLLSETAWTIVVWGNDADHVTIVENHLALPSLGETHISIFHGDTKLGAVDVAIDETDPHVAQTLEPGQHSRPISMLAGPFNVRLGNESNETKPMDLASGRSNLLILRPGGGRTLIETDPERPLDGECRVRIVDVRADPAQPMAIHYEGRPLEVDTPHLLTARAPVILLATALAKRLDAQVGSRISISTPYRGLGARGNAPMGMEPTSGRFEVAGIFRTGYHDYDKRFAIISFSAATRFLNSGDRPKWLEVRVDDLLQIDDRKQVVEQIVQPYGLPDMMVDLKRITSRITRVTSGDVRQYSLEEPTSALSTLRNTAQVMESLRTTVPYGIGPRRAFNIITWREMNAPLFSALKLQKNVLSIIFAIIILVAAFNIVGTQIMLVHEKTREISILKAMGATGSSIKSIFLMQGLLISGLGTGLGLILGLGACVLVDQVGYPLEPEVYLISELPVAIDLTVIGFIAFISLTLTLLSTLYSAGRAGRLLPVQGIRYVE